MPLYVAWPARLWSAPFNQRVPFRSNEQPLIVVMIAEYVLQQCASMVRYGGASKRLLYI